MDEHNLLFDNAEEDDPQIDDSWVTIHSKADGGRLIAAIPPWDHNIIEILSAAGSVVQAKRHGGDVLGLIDDLAHLMGFGEEV